jgi:hypothetical protein
MGHYPREYVQPTRLKAQLCTCRAARRRRSSRPCHTDDPPPRHSRRRAHIPACDAPLHLERCHRDLPPRGLRTQLQVDDPGARDEAQGGVEPYERDVARAPAGGVPKRVPEYTYPCACPAHSLIGREPCSWPDLRRLLPSLASGLLSPPFTFLQTTS